MVKFLQMRFTTSKFSKYGKEKTPYLDTFHAVMETCLIKASNSLLGEVI